MNNFIRKRVTKVQRFDVTVILRRNILSHIVKLVGIYFLQVLILISTQTEVNRIHQELSYRKQIARQLYKH